MRLWSYSGGAGRNGRSVLPKESINERREAIVTGIAGITATVAVAPRTNAEASPEANPDLDQIRALLQAHDEAFTNQDLDTVMACFQGPFD